MKQSFLLFSIFVIIFNGCSKVEVVDLPITTSSPKALTYYKSAMLSFQVGDAPEKRALLDSAFRLPTVLISDAGEVSGAVYLFSGRSCVVALRIFG